METIAYMAFYTPRYLFGFIASRWWNADVTTSTRPIHSFQFPMPQSKTVHQRLLEHHRTGVHGDCPCMVQQHAREGGRLKHQKIVILGHKAKVLKFCIATWKMIQSLQ
jgi:hypothetical protein